MSASAHGPPLDAFHLPGLDPAEIEDWSVREYAPGVILRFPRLRPDQLSAVLRRLRERRARVLADRPVAEIAAVLAAAAARLAREDDARRRIALDALPAITGYSPPMVRLVLDRMVEDWSEPSLLSLLRSEFHDPGVLDGFRPHPARQGGQRTRVFGPELAFHIFAGNVPGVAVTSIVRSLLVKAATFGKAASGEPLLPALFAQTLADVDRQLGECLAVTYWPGGSEALEAAAFEAADTIVVYGGAGVAEDVRRRAPADRRVVVHGPRFSLGLIGRAALAAPRVDETAAQAAGAVAIFDQQGCVSPHVYYVEQGGETTPAEFAERLAAHLARLEAELPRGTISPAEAGAIQVARADAEARALAGADVQIHAPRGTGFTVIYDPDPAFAPSPLNRTIRVKPVADLADTAALVRPIARFIQTVAIAGAGGRLEGLAELLGRAGASRITSLARMPWPPVTAHHDGQEPLRELVRWTDLED